MISIITVGRFLRSFAWLFLVSQCSEVNAQESMSAKSVKRVRFRVEDKPTIFGVVEGDKVREISGSIYADWKPTDKVHELEDVQLVVPTQPKHIFAMAGNYKSHLKDAEIPPSFAFRSHS